MKLIVLKILSQHPMFLRHASSIKFVLPIACLLKFNFLLCLWNGSSPWMIVVLIWEICATSSWNLQCTVLLYSFLLLGFTVGNFLFWILSYLFFFFFPGTYQRFFSKAILVIPASFPFVNKSHVSQVLFWRLLHIDTENIELRIM